MNAAEPLTDASTNRSPASDVPAPPPPATRPTPASASSEPTHAASVAVPRPSAVAIIATSTGTAPTIREARERQPAGVEPAHAELGKRHGEAPQRAGCGKRDERSRGWAAVEHLKKI